MAGRIVQGSHTGLQDVLSRSTSTQKRHGSRWGSAFIWKLRQEITWGGVWCHYEWHLAVHMSILVGKLVTTWMWTQCDTRPCLVVYHYKGEGKADGQMSGHHWDGLSSVSPEDRDTCISCIFVHFWILVSHAKYPTFCLRYKFIRTKLWNKC